MVPSSNSTARGRQSKSHGNIRYKFQQEVEQERLRIVDVRFLDINEEHPLRYMDARNRFAVSVGFELKGYVGRFVKPDSQ